MNEPTGKVLTYELTRCALQAQAMLIEGLEKAVAVRKRIVQRDIADVSVLDDTSGWNGGTADHYVLAFTKAIAAFSEGLR